MQKIPLALLLRLAGKSRHIQKFAVKLDVIFAFGGEGRPNGLIRDEVGRKESFIRVEHEDASHRH